MLDPIKAPALCRLVTLLIALLLVSSGCDNDPSTQPDMGDTTSSNSSNSSNNTSANDTAGDPDMGEPPDMPPAPTEKGWKVTGGLEAVEPGATGGGFEIEGALEPARAQPASGGGFEIEKAPTPMVEQAP